MFAPRSSLALAAAILGIAVAWSAAPAQTPLQTNAVPPPPPTPIHSYPGPYLAEVGRDGAILDLGVIDNAVGHWAEPLEKAFVLCFQSASTPIDWTLALAALDDAAAALHKRDAVAVISSGRVCNTPPHGSMKGRPYVELLGVLRPRKNGAAVH